MLRHRHCPAGQNRGEHAICIDYDHRSGGFDRVLLGYHCRNGSLEHREPVVLDRRGGISTAAAAGLPAARRQAARRSEA